MFDNTVDYVVDCWVDGRKIEALNKLIEFIDSDLQIKVFKKLPAEYRDSFIESSNHCFYLVRNKSK